MKHIARTLAPGLFGLGALTAHAQNRTIVAVGQMHIPEGQSSVVDATPSVEAGEVYYGTATLPAFYKLAANGTLRWVYRNAARRTFLPPTNGEAITEKLRG